MFFFSSSRYGCFFTAKPNSRCLSFQGGPNYKGPDGILLCYKTETFKEIARKNFDLPNDGRFGRQVNLFFLLSKKNNIKISFSSGFFNS